jgi:hypothetical protein
MFNKILIANRGGRAVGAGARSCAQHVSVAPDRLASAASGDRAAGA